jgi:hypothetical protein
MEGNAYVLRRRIPIQQAAVYSTPEIQEKKDAFVVVVPIRKVLHRREKLSKRLLPEKTSTR